MIKKTVMTVMLALNQLVQKLESIVRKRHDEYLLWNHTWDSADMMCMLTSPLAPPKWVGVYCMSSRTGE